MLNETRKAYIIMLIVVLIWGLEFIAAKIALDALAPITLAFFRYCVAFVVMSTIKHTKEPTVKLQKEDIPKVMIASVLGTTLYYTFEYNSLSYISVSTLSIILAAVPIVSMLTDAIAYKNPITGKTTLGTILSLAGVFFIVSTDVEDLMSGTFWGYLLAFMAVLSWNIYNFFTKDMYERYSNFSIPYYQIIFALISMAPFALLNLPDKGTVTPKIIISVLFLGIISSSFAYILYIYCLNKIGVTPTTLFSNFLPVVTIVLSWLILKETITLAQIIGGLLVITAAIIVIYRKNTPNANDSTDISHSI